MPASTQQHSLKYDSKISSGQRAGGY